MSAPAPAPAPAPPPVYDGFGTRTGGSAPPATAPARTGAQLIVQALAENGVDALFNLPGNGVYPMLDPLADYPSIRYVMGLHEGSLVHMADGYARASGRVPFVNLYMVPGTTNALSAVYAASRDRVPLIVTATQQTRGIVGRDAYASTDDLVGLARPFTKWAWEVNAPERLPEAIHRAHKIASTHPRGPVFLSLPVDLFREPLDRPLNEPSKPTAVPSFGPPPPELVRDVAERLLAAERVLFIAGKDAVTADAVDELVALAEELGAAVASEPWTAAVGFPRPHRLHFGEYHRGTLEKLDPGVVVGIGARLFMEAVQVPEAGFPEGTYVATLGLDPAEMGSHQRVDAAAVCDLKVAVRALLEACRGRLDGATRGARLERIEAYQRELRAERESFLAQGFENRPMSLARLSTELNKAIDAHTLLVEHATTSTGMLMSFLDLPNPRNVFGTSGSVQGWGTPAAIGIQLARPDRKVLAVVGDGGITFTCQSLWTAGHYGAPVTVVVLNNRGYRSMRGGVARGAPHAVAAGVDFGYDFEVGICDVARGFGVDAVRIEDPADVADAVRAAMQDDRPSVVEIMISPALTFVPSRTTPVAL